MKKKIMFFAALLVLTFLPATFSFAKAKTIQFRLVLSKEEAKSIPNKKYSYIAHKGQASKEVLVSKEVLLSREDIDSMVVIKKEDSRYKDFPEIDVVFTKEGSAKLAKVTEQNLRKSIAIVVDDQIFSAPYIVYPVVKGHFLISNWKVDTDEAAKNFVSGLGFTPTVKDVTKGQANK